MTERIISVGNDPSGYEVVVTELPAQVGSDELAEVRDLGLQPYLYRPPLSTYDTRIIDTYPIATVGHTNDAGVYNEIPERQRGYTDPNEEGEQ